MMLEDSQITRLATQLIGLQSSHEHMIHEELNDQPLSSSSKQNLIGIWYHDENISENQDLMRKMRDKLYMAFYYVRIFNDRLDFTRYLLSSFIVENIFFIISSQKAESLCGIAKNRLQRRHVYKFQVFPDSTSSSFPTFDDIDKLFQQICIDLKIYLTIQEDSSATIIQDEDCHRLVFPLSLNIFNSNTKQNSFRYWTKESLEFYRFQALTGLLTKMSCDHQTSLDDMMRECRNYYFGNTAQGKKIDDLNENYDANDAILYYTQDLFLFRMMGRAFRSEDIECIFKFRRFIIDLHHQLADVAKHYKPKQKTLYRGKKLHPVVLQQLNDNTGAIVSMNGFLSTTCNRDKAIKVYAGAGETLTGHESDKSVLFELSVGEAGVARPFADIESISHFAEEEEVLFTMGSIWTIGSVKPSNDLWWTVELKSCDELDPKLVQFLKQLPDDHIFLTLGDVLRELGQHTKAKNFYYRMLDEPTVSDQIRGTLFYKIAMINIAQGEDFEAKRNLHEAAKLIPSAVTNTEPASSQPLYAHDIISSPLPIVYNMGRMYQKIGDKNKALQYFTEAADIKESGPAYRAIVEDSIGMLLYSEGKYPDALKHLSKAIELAQEHSCTICITKFKHNYDAVNRHLLSSNCCSESK